MGSLRVHLAAWLALAACLSVGAVSGAEQAASPRPRAAAPPAPGDATRQESALRTRVAAYWQRRQAQDLAGMYDFYSAAYRTKVSRDNFLQQTRLVRFPLTAATVTRVAITGERADVTISYSFIYPTLRLEPLASATEEVWVRERNSWFKLDEPFVTPFPTLPAGPPPTGPAPEDVTPPATPTVTPGVAAPPSTTAPAPTPPPVALPPVTPPPAARLVQPLPDGRVSVHAVDVSLGMLLRELGDAGGFSKFTIGASADGRTVSVSLDRLSRAAAIVETLKAADVAYVFVGGAEPGIPYRLVADSIEIASENRVAAASGPVPASTAAAAADGVEDADARDAAVAASAQQTQQAVSALSQQLVAPPVAPTASGIVALPFPGASGAPATQLILPTALHALPFPTSMPAMPAAPSPATATTPAAPRDPAVEALERALAPSSAVAPSSTTSR